MAPEYYLKGAKRVKTHSRHLFLFCDFDGTLVPIQNNPADCILSNPVRDELKRIHRSSVASVVIMSGRSLSDIKKRVQIKGIYYGGSHGLEITGPGIRFIHPDAQSFKPMIKRASRYLAKVIHGVPGVFIEKKNFSFTLHFRMAHKEHKRLARRMFYTILSRDFPEHTFKIIKGKQVLELSPDVKWDKGNAVLYILQTLNNDIFPVYIGDDFTDEKAFTALKDRGITVRVGKSVKTEAQYYLKGHYEVLRFLKTIYGSIEQ